MKPLPDRCCGRCVAWARKNPADVTAPEGFCGLEKEPPFWPSGYWPNTLQRDGCSKFKKSPAALSAA